MEHDPTQYVHSWLTVALLCCLAGGCAHATYYASDLPEEYQAPTLPDTQALDLTRFAKPTTTTDLVEPGDVVQVSISTGLETYYRSPSWKLRVDSDGVVMVPIVGPVRVAGLSLSQADQAIYDAAVSRGFYRNPNVAVTRMARRESRIIVSGAVKRPGSYDLPASSCDVLSALVAAGGLNPDADTVIEVRQPNGPATPHEEAGGERFASYQQQSEAPQQTVRLDLTKPHQIQDLDVVLGDGAVITVPERPDHVVAVMGKVKRPGQFDLPDGTDMRFLDAVALAGGKTSAVADKAYIVRQASEQTEPVVIRVSIRDAKANPDANLRLAPGDVVSVEETPLTLGVETLTKLIRFSVGSRLVF